jgi:hypothetical protein
LATIATFVPVQGMDPGKYELKPEFMAQCNPYHLHLGRELHEQARARCSKWRSQQSPSMPPLSLPSPPPLPLFASVPMILTTRGTLHILHVLLEKISATPMTATAAVSETVLSMTLDMLVLGVQVVMAQHDSTVQSHHSPKVKKDQNDIGFDDDSFSSFWASLASFVPHFNTLLHDAHGRLLLDKEQQHVLTWLLKTLPQHSSVCAEELKRFHDLCNLDLTVDKNSRTRSNHVDGEKTGAEKGTSIVERTTTGANSKNGSSTLVGSSIDDENSTVTRSMEKKETKMLTLQERKEQAKERALAAMAKQQAMFSQSMMMQLEEEKEKEPITATGPSSLHKKNHGKRKKGKERNAEAPDEENDDEEEEDEARSAKKVKGWKQLKSKHHPEDEKEEAEEEPLSCCILCHEDNKREEMGIVAFVHRSTVLSSGFRPHPDDALTAQGETTRQHIDALIQQMHLTSIPGHTHNQNHSFSRRRSPEFRPQTPPSNNNSILARFRFRNNENIFRGLNDLFFDLVHDNDDDDISDDEYIHMDHLENDNDDDNLDDNDENENEDDEDEDEDENENEHHEDDNEDADANVTELRNNAVVNALGGVIEQAVLLHQRTRGATRRLPRATNAGSRRNHRRFRPFHNDAPATTSAAATAVSKSRQKTEGLAFVPVGWFGRSCHHHVHMRCLETYVCTLHEKALRGEEFDGMQAVDEDASMTQFLCPLCKSLCNILLPVLPVKGPTVARPKKTVDKTENTITSRNGASAKTMAWYSIMLDPMCEWSRPLRKPTSSVHDGDLDETHRVYDMWKGYYEEMLWEAHGSFEKVAPFMWSCCAYTITATLADVEFTNATSAATPVDIMGKNWPASLVKEMPSLTALVQFARWSFDLLEFTADSKVMYETLKRCCPVHHDSKREYRKYTQVRGHDTHSIEIDRNRS